MIFLGKKSNQDVIYIFFEPFLQYKSKTQRNTLGPSLERRGTCCGPPGGCERGMVEAAAKVGSRASLDSPFEQTLNFLYCGHTVCFIL
jgi:hypothetical protein